MYEQQRIYICIRTIKSQNGKFSRLLSILCHYNKGQGYTFSLFSFALRCIAFPFTISSVTLPLVANACESFCFGDWSAQGHAPAILFASADLRRGVGIWILNYGEELAGRMHGWSWRRVIAQWILQACQRICILKNQLLGWVSDFFDKMVICDVIFLRNCAFVLSTLWRNASDVCFTWAITNYRSRIISQLHYFFPNN